MEREINAWTVRRGTHMICSSSWLNGAGRRSRSPHLPGTPTREHEPAIERRRLAFAPAAGPDAKGRCSPLDGPTEAEVLVGNEPRQAHPVGPTCMFFAAVTACLCLVHGLHLLTSLGMTCEAPRRPTEAGQLYFAAGPR